MATTKTSQQGVYRRGGTYAYVISLGRDPDTGKRRQQWVGGFGTVTEAAAARRDALGDVDKGTYVPPTRQTLEAYLDSWVEGQASQVKPSTHASYKWLLDTYVIRVLGTAELQRVSPTALTKFYSRLHREGGANGKPLSLRTVKYTHSVLRKALNDAVKARALVVNPALAADVPRLEHDAEGASDDMQAWTAADLRTFLAAVPEPVSNALYSVVVNNGLRRGEALALGWEDLDLDEPRMHVRWNVVMVDGQLRYGTPKGGKKTSRHGGRRTFRIDPETVAVLRAWKKAQAEQKLAWEGEWANDRDLVFTQADGSPIRPDVVTKRFGKDVEASGVRRIRLHDYPDICVIPTSVCEPLPCRVIGLLMSA